MQNEYQDWLDSLLPGQEDSTMAEMLEALVDIDLSELEEVEFPRGFGRD